MAYYKDLREFVSALETNHRLVRIKREINKDTEAIPLVRCQFRGLPEEDRKAFLFENVVDVRGKIYNIPLLVASHAASKQVYALGMKCEPEEINDKWMHAQLCPIEPTLVRTGPVQDEVHAGDNLLEHGGLEEFPIPISTPGFDNAPYITSACWVTKDPDTGIRNVGTYRAMVKSKSRTGIMLMAHQHLRQHWEKCRSKGIPLQAAMVIGATPNMFYTSSAKFPYGVDEYSIAGGIAGEPVELVKCKTIDIEVPARAEIVLEGEFPIDHLEREGPFGEYSGYLSLETEAPSFNINCITHRKGTIYNAIISEFPPSESSVLRQFSKEGIFYKFLKQDCNIPGILDVAFHEGSGSSPWITIKMKKTHPTQPWQALNAAAALSPSDGKIIVVVDEDIDPRDTDSVIWAICWRMQPHRDMRVTTGKNIALDNSLSKPAGPRSWSEAELGSILLIDATLKWGYPPISLPKKEFMERASKIWEEERLPPLTLKSPWYGYPLGLWDKENEEEANLALKGQHYQTGEKLARNRKKI